jgi:hypothetical protein
MDIEQDGVRGLPTRRFDVFRLTQDVGDRSSVGVMALQRHSSGDEEPTHRAIGLDVDLNPADALLVSTYAALTDEDGLGDDNATWGTRARWSHPLGVLTYLHESIGEDYTPRAGFVERTGIDVNALGWEFTPEPDGKWIRRFENQGFFYWIDRRNGPFESRYIHVNPVVVGPNEERVSLYWERDFDRLFEPFPIGPDIEFPEGEFTYDYWGAELQTNPSHWWHAALDARRGEFFDGDLSEVTLALGLRRAPRWQASVEIERARLERAGSRFDSDVVRLRVGHDWNNNFGVDVFAQYNASQDLVLSQWRAHWIFGDESDLYFVVTDARDDGTRDWSVRRGEFTLKLSYSRLL